MKESKEDNVDLGGISALSLEMIVDFLYSGKLDLNLDCLIDILTAATHLQIQTALDLCSDFIISLLTFANADELLKIVDLYTLDRVKDFYTEKLFNEFEDFSHSNGVPVNFSHRISELPVRRQIESEIRKYSSRLYCPLVFAR